MYVCMNIFMYVVSMYCKYVLNLQYYVLYVLYIVLYYIVCMYVCMYACVFLWNSMCACRTIIPVLVVL